MLNKLRKRLSARGFTLVELIVVMAVIAILVLLAAPKFLGYTREAIIKQAQNDSKVVENSMDIYLLEHDAIDSALTPVNASDLQTIADRGSLVDKKGLISDVPDEIFYELPPEYIQSVLEVKKPARNAVYTTSDGYVVIDINSNGIPPGENNGEGEPEGPIGESQEESDTYYEVEATGVLTEFYPTGKLDTLERLYYISIPETLNGITITSIADSVFDGTYHDYALIGVNIPDTISHIGEFAFQNNQITELTIPGSVEVIGSRAFAENQIQSIVFNEGLKSLGGASFSNNQISELYLPQSLETIGGMAFKANRLSALDIPDGVIEIDLYAFTNNQIKHLTLGQSVQKIGESAFSDGTWGWGGEIDESYITELILPESLIAIGQNSFRGHGIESLVIPDSVVSIGASAFYENNIETLTLGNSLKTINSNAFYRNKITSITVPDGLENIGAWAFAYNSNLTSLHIGTESQLTNIDVGAFQNSNISSTVRIPGSIKTISASAFKENPITELILEEGIETIGREAFSQYIYSTSSRLTQLNLPESVKTIDALAFAYQGFENLSIPPGVTTIGEEAFKNGKIKFLELNNGLTTIERRAFSKNAIENELTIPSSVTIVGQESFRNNNLTTVHITSNNTAVYMNAFFNNSGNSGSFTGYSVKTWTLNLYTMQWE